MGMGPANLSGAVPITIRDLDGRGTIAFLKSPSLSFKILGKIRRKNTANLH